MILFPVGLGSFVRGRSGLRSYIGVCPQLDRLAAATSKQAHILYFHFSFSHPKTRLIGNGIVSHLRRPSFVRFGSIDRFHGPSPDGQLIEFLFGTRSHLLAGSTLV